jgi:hypothetical protein
MQVFYKYFEIERGGKCTIDLLGISSRLISTLLVLVPLMATY